MLIQYKIPDPFSWPRTDLIFATIDEWRQRWMKINDPSYSHRLV
ncbi:MAG: hypothetical protein OJF52_000208 [Nitrospira sp.]|jgi:hypothetical protein|nr:MAG: hypothetical protein OJF52_000208 [Nitrospira sp.]